MAGGVIPGAAQMGRALQDLLMGGSTPAPAQMGGASQNLLMGGASQHLLRWGEHPRSWSGGVEGQVGAEVGGLKSPVRDTPQV